jgi:HD-like signal output (HDOD) protein
MPADRSGTSPSMEQMIDTVDRLHSSPLVALRIVELLRDPEFDPYDVAECLESDPALAATILQLVNSSSLGLARKVFSLRHAIAYLGVRSLRLTVLSFGLVDRLTRGVPARVCSHFWRRALTMAAGAAQLHGRRRGAQVDEAYSAGLLSDVGVLLLAQVDTQHYALLYAAHEHGGSLIEAERQRYEFDHAMLGAGLLTRWNLPADLTDAVALHHDPQPNAAPLARAVHAGDLLADVLWTPHTPRLPGTRRLLATEFDLDVDGFITLAQECRDDVAQKAKLFRADLDGTIDCDELRAVAMSQHRSEALQSALDLDSFTAIVEGDYGPPVEPLVD